MCTQDTAPNLPLPLLEQQHTEPDFCRVSAVWAPPPPYYTIHYQLVVTSPRHTWWLPGPSNCCYICYIYSQVNSNRHCSQLTSGVYCLNLHGGDTSAPSYNSQVTKRGGEDDPPPRDFQAFKCQRRRPTELFRDKSWILARPSRKSVPQGLLQQR